ncbi:hypothetical protein BMETH_2221_1 [methanotrophic bacterial endosymbiont of Bathymodiolus sp.]|nr:hypothetical protein BMETH_2221_1 [methanotrophic bacterial endosymbiont of Bathymodiolus sp.]
MISPLATVYWLFALIVVILFAKIWHRIFIALVMAVLMT